MKKIFLITLLFAQSILSQVVDPASAPIKADTNVIMYKVAELENYLNNASKYNYEQPAAFLDEAYKIELKNSTDFIERTFEYSRVSVQVNKIEVNGNSANVNCTYLYYDDHNVSRIFTDYLFFEKQNKWVISNLGTLKNIFLMKYSANEKVETSNIAKESQQIFLSTNTLITKHAFRDPDTYQIDMNLTQMHLQKQLFGAYQGIDNTYFYGAGAETAFYLDQDWNRLLFSQKHPTQLNIYSYGQKTNEYHFSSPRSIDVNEWGELYIADSDTKVINKFYYSPFTNTITAIQNVNFIQGLNKPVDVDYYQGNTLFNRNDDIIVVADEGDNSLLIYKFDGTFQCKLSGYYENGVRNIVKPRRVAVYGYEKPYRIAFIDGGTNRLIVVRLPENFSNWLGWLQPTSTPVSFESPSYLTDVGIDGCYNVLVPDRDKNMIHKFNKDGVYSCTFPGGNDFVFPNYVTNVTDNCPDPAMVWVDIAVASSWEENNGIRRYLPGADLKNIEHSNLNTYYRLRFTPTDDIFYIAQLIRVQDNAIVKSYSGYAFTAKEKDIILDYADLPTANTNYKWKFLFDPYFNNQYSPYQIAMQVREIGFYHSLTAPIISGLTQTPVPIYKGCPNGKVICNLSQGNNSNPTYSWTLLNPKPGLSLSSVGNMASITYSVAEMISSNKKVSTDDIVIPQPRVRCSVSNGAGSDTKEITLYLADQPPSGGCPFVYSWNGEDWMEDNNILPQSQDSTIFGQDVTDFYQLFTKPRLEENKYYLAVGEFEHEKSYIDQLKLLVVDHPQETFITVSEEGQVIQFAKPAYFASAELDSNDVFKQLYRMDEERVTTQRDETMTLTFEDAAGSEEKWLVLIAQVAHAAKYKIAGNIIDKNKESFTSFRLRKNPSYQWVLVPQGNSSTLQVDILWKGESEVDYTELSRRLELPFTLYTPELLNAEHSVVGDVKNQLLLMDEDRTELSPNEWITLEFAAPPVNEGMERSFVFVSRGRYESLPDTSVIEGKKRIPMLKKSSISSVSNSLNEVKEYKLNQNYPNPFNPITTIHYSVKEPGFVSLKLYNLLGREIATIVSEEKGIGSYTINYYASNLPSGVYVCRFKVNEFSSLMKMVVLK